MISHKYKCIFTHIQKNGGTSIKVPLGKLNGYFHHPAREQKNVFGKYWGEYYKFSIVRNPWDRIVSIYHYYLLNNEPSNSKIKQIMPKTFESFCKSYLGDNPQKWMTGWLGGEYILQKNWITNKNGDIIIDYVGRYETINESFEHIKKELSINGELPHIRKSDHKNYKEYYTNELIELVRNKLKEDIELFDYKF